MNPKEIADGISEMLNTPYNVDFNAIQSKAELAGAFVDKLLGVTAVLIMMFMPLMTLLDILYLTIPLMRDEIHKRNWDGSRDIKTFRLVSNDARLAYEECAVVEGKMPIWAYLKKRTVTIAMCTAIVIVIVGYSGQIVAAVQSMVIRLLT